MNTTYYYRVVASNSAGTTPGTGRSFTTPPITLTITSPSDGDTIYGPDIMVTGTVTNATGSETGVSVNGILANMNGSEFFVNHVSLEEGANTITATATDTSGNTASTSIVVQAEAADYVTLNANTESGISPLTTYFSVTTSIPNAVASYEMDYEGDGTVDYTGGVATLHCLRQVWVHVDYSAYRPAYIRYLRCISVDRDILITLTSSLLKAEK